MAVGVGVMEGTAVELLVAEIVTSAPSNDSLEAWDCSAETWLEMLEFAHKLRILVVPCSSPSRLVTSWSIE